MAEGKLGPIYAAKELQAYGSWFVDAWTAQATALLGAAGSTPQPDALLGGAALGISSVLKAGATALNAMAVMQLLDDPTAGQRSPFDTPSASGRRLLSVAVDAELDTDSTVTIPAAEVMLYPKVLEQDDARFYVWAMVEGHTPGKYVGKVTVEVEGQPGSAVEQDVEFTL
jgi:hypothetical protein